MRLKCSEQTIDENMILYMIFVWMTNIEFLFRRIGSFFEILKACDSLNQLYDISRFSFSNKRKLCRVPCGREFSSQTVVCETFFYRFMVHRSVAEYILHTHIYFLNVYYIPRFFFRVFNTLWHCTSFVKCSLLFVFIETFLVFNIYNHISLVCQLFEVFAHTLKVECYVKSLWHASLLVMNIHIYLNFSYFPHLSCKNIEWSLGT